MKESLKRTLEILGALSQREVSELRPEMELVADLGIDSPKALELLLEIEEAFDIEIDDDDAAEMATVGDVLDYVGAQG